MGQQQLILLVLATVIVGLAIVVGIRAFSENNLKANSDAMTQDVLRIANDAQAWMMKPEAMGGSLDADKATLDWSNIDFQQIGYAVGTIAACGGGQGYANLNGCYTLNGTPGTLTITASTDNSGSALDAALTTANQITATITGLRDDDIAVVVTLGAY